VTARPHDPDTSALPDQGLESEATIYTVRHAVTDEEALAGKPLIGDLYREGEEGREWLEVISNTGELTIREVKQDFGAGRYVVITPPGYPKPRSLTLRFTVGDRKPSGPTQPAKDYGPVDGAAARNIERRAAAEAEQEERQRSETKIRELRAELGELQDQLRRAKRDLTEAVSQREDAKAEVRGLNLRLDAAKADAQTVRTLYEGLRDRHDQEQRSYADDRRAWLDERAEILARHTAETSDLRQEVANLRADERLHDMELEMARKEAGEGNSMGDLIGAISGLFGQMPPETRTSFAQGLGESIRSGFGGSRAVPHAPASTLPPSAVSDPTQGPAPQEPSDPAPATAEGPAPEPAEPSMSTRDQAFSLLHAHFLAAVEGQEDAASADEFAQAVAAVYEKETDPTAWAEFARALILSSAETEASPDRIAAYVAPVAGRFYAEVPAIARHLPADALAGEVLKRLNVQATDRTQAITTAAIEAVRQSAA